MKPFHLIPMWCLCLLFAAGCGKTEDGDRVLKLPFSATKKVTINASNIVGVLFIDSIKQANPVKAVLGLNGKTLEQMKYLKIKEVKLTATNNVSLDALELVKLDFFGANLPNLEVGKKQNIAANSKEITLDIANENVTAYFRSDSFYTIPAVRLQKAITTPIEVDYKITFEIGLF